MNAHKISIMDAEHGGCHWIDPAPFVIKANPHQMGDALHDAPVTVHLLAGTQPDRAAALLREVAAALDRNGRKWLPALVQDLNRPSDELNRRLDALAEYGRMVEVVAFEDGHQYPEVISVCSYRDKTARVEYSPTVRLEVACGTSPKEVLELLAAITASVKATIKKDGAAAFAPENGAGWADDGEVPF